jgi:hypothetical protein
MYAHVMPHLPLISRHKGLVLQQKTHYLFSALCLVLSERSFYFILFISIPALVTNPISLCLVEFIVFKYSCCLVCVVIVLRRSYRP